MFGFTGTPIFSENAIYQIREGEEASYKTIEDIFQKCLHTYTITHAIDDRNVLKFHIVYFNANPVRQVVQTGHALSVQAVVEAILDKHHSSTNSRWFNAIEYYQLFKQMQEDLTQEREDNKQNPEEKKKALIEIIADFNTQYGTNHDINNFDTYYQDIQSRIKNQKDSNKYYTRKTRLTLP